MTDEISLANDNKKKLKVEYQNKLSKYKKD